MSTVRSPKKFILAAVAALSLLLGTAAFAAPATADVEPMRTGSTAYFNAIEGGIPLTIDFHVVKVSGSFFYLSWGERLSNVKYVCPKSSSYYIRYKNPHGSVGNLDYGECLWPQFRGEYQLTYRKTVPGE